MAEQEVSKNAKTYQLEQRYLNCTTISGTKSHHCFIPLSKSKLAMKRLSLDDEGVLVKLYDNTTKSDLPHLQLIENDLYPGKYVACIYDQDWYIGVITKHSNENKDVYIKSMK